jgi:hypothetical protein
LVAAYRFWNSSRVSPRGILASHAKRTGQRAAKEPVVLAIQDTTEVDSTRHRATRGLGYLGSLRRRGLLLHTVIAASEDGLPLGVLRQIVWHRPLNEFGKRKDRRKTPLLEKESRRWLHGMAAAQVLLKDHPHVVVIGDRESDFFPLFAAPRAPNVDLLIRVSREKRRVEHSAKYLDAAVQQAPVGGAVQIEVPRRAKRKARTATLQVRWAYLEVRAPRNGPRLPSVRLWFIQLEEIDVPKGVVPIRWLLATTQPVSTFEDALRDVRRYAHRWMIEQYHQVFKDGCRIEDLQLKTADGIRRAIAMYGIVAWRVLWMTLQARRTPDAPCTRILKKHEWQALHATVHEGEPLPAQVPTLRNAIRMVARLGGFLGRKRDGEPGTKTIWRGLRRLNDLARAWRLAQLHVKDPKC